MESRFVPGSGLGIAVFTRNHEMHIENAVRLSQSDPERLIPFRSVSRWVTAARALAKGASIPLYIALTDGDGTVAYVADLCEVVLNPSREDARTKELLALAEGTSTSSEGLWEKNGVSQVGTLYAIRHCREQDPAFSLTDLVKVSDGQPLSSTFKYGYALVRPFVGDRTVGMR